MSRAFFVLFAVLALGACDGGETTAPDAGRDGASGSCAGLADGESCGSGLVCSGGACVESRCGDGIVDTASGEECEDGNDVAFDGCDPGCELTCTEDGECDDGDPCNGDDTCDLETHVCERGTAPPVGSPCTAREITNGVCNAATPPACVEAGCGNGVVDSDEDCDDGRNGDDEDGCTDACEFTCTDVSQCSDSDVCTGEETCDLTTHACITAPPLTCTASDACHAASCDPAMGCTEALIDADGDGHAPTASGACGTDCDDSDATIFIGAEELCDGRNNDCDSMTDESAPTWYIDCDGDAYAASTDSSRVSCAEPPASATGCSLAAAGWTTRRPLGAADTDCDDTQASVAPGATETIGDEIDQDCDGAEVCYLDGDDDGFRRDDGLTLASTDLDCGDAREALASEPPTDCNDSSASVRPGAAEVPGDEVDQSCDGREVCYRDEDDDGYRTSSTFTSTDADCNDSGEAIAADPATDCCDRDANTRPGTTTYRTTANACGSFDYNCSGAAEARYGTGTCGLANSSCSNQRDGFVGSPPACGASGSYLDSCTPEYEPELRRWFCLADGTRTLTQSCR